MDGGTLTVQLGCVQNVAQNQRILEPEGSWFSVKGSEISWMPETLRLPKDKEKKKTQPNKIGSSPCCKLTMTSEIR